MRGESLRYSRVSATKINTSTSSTEKGMLEQKITAFVSSMKCSIMQTLGNMAYEHIAVQTQVRELDGINPILCHCVSHPHYPMLREWTIMTLRNLTEYNSENANWIRQLSPLKTLQTPELQALGMNCEVDTLSGKIKLKQDLNSKLKIKVKEKNTD